MIVRYFLVTLGIFLGLTACSGGKGTDTTDDPTGDDDDDDDDDDDNDTESGDSGTTGDQFFDVTFLMVDSSFGYDSTAGTIVSAITPYGEIPSTIGVYLGEPAWEAAGFAFDSDAYCAIFLPLTDATPAVFASSVPLWFGFNYDTADAPGTNCNTEGFELDPNEWGTAPELDFASYGWGIGIGALWPAFEADYATSDLVEEILGGYINNTLLPAPDGQEGYVAAARQMDATYQLVTDADGYLVLLLSADVNLGGNIATAHYIIIPRLIWSFK